MNTDRINDIREAANQAAISDIANQLAHYVQLKVSEKELKEFMLEIAYVLNRDYGSVSDDIDNVIYTIDKKLHGKEAETGVDKSDV